MTKMIEEIIFQTGDKMISFVAKLPRTFLNLRTPAILLFTDGT